MTRSNDFVLSTPPAAAGSLVRAAARARPRVRPQVLRLATALCVAIGLTAMSPEAAAETLATLSLDALSYVSFEDHTILAIPEGGAVGLRLGAPDAAGSVPVRIEPGDLVLPAIPLPDGTGVLEYTLVAPAAGTLRTTSDGVEIALSATVGATLRGTEHDGTKTYTLTFTTGDASATSPVTGERVALSGAPAHPEARYVQLVGAVANAADAQPEPGRAVSIVLSGTFDRLE